MIVCPTCSTFKPSADEERAIRQHERQLIAGALEALVTDGERERLTRALDQIEPGSSRILGRVIHELLSLCEDDEAAA